MFKVTQGYVLPECRHSAFSVSSALSDKVRVLSLALILLVVYLHVDFPEGMAFVLPLALRTMLVGVFGPVAVPLFYMISGYFFFQTAKDIEGVFANMYKRVNTLLIPFVIGALVYPLFFLAVENIPFAVPYLNKIYYTSQFRDLSFIELSRSIFIVGRNNMPWAFHLWFLRDLLVIVLCSPLLYYLRRVLGLWSLLPLLVMIFIVPNLSFVSGAFYFVFGSLFLPFLSFSKSIVFPFLFLLFVVRRLLGLEFGCEDNVGIVLIISEVLLGSVTLWQLFDRIVPANFILSKYKSLSVMCRYTFFIYLFHVPAVQIIFKTMLIILGNNALGYTVAFLISPLAIAMALVGLGVLLRAYVPKFYILLSGGR